MEVKILRYFLTALVCISLTACPARKTAKTVSVKAGTEIRNSQTPKFNADSAYQYIEDQVAFGPRVPNTEAHKACKNYLATKLESFGAKVTLQDMSLEAYDGSIYEATNIIGSYNPTHPDRIILCAHWDTRHVADYDPDKSMERVPIDGANDGGSGVGVLLEIARILKTSPLDFGIDIIFFDAEDQGRPRFLSFDPNSTETWCLGSQYWSRNPHTQNYKARYGILLDMVGARDAVFPMEGYSMRYASGLTTKLWNLAAQLGYSHYFIFERSAPVTDDHYFINTIAKIPCTDIIHYRPGHSQGFGDFWHTHDDNMSVIHKPTLEAVGTVVLTHIYTQAF